MDLQWNKLCVLWVQKNKKRVKLMPSTTYLSKDCGKGTLLLFQMVVLTNNSIYTKQSVIKIFNQCIIHRFGRVWNDSGVFETPLATGITQDHHPPMPFHLAGNRIPQRQREWRHFVSDEHFLLVNLYSVFIALQLR